MANPTVDPAQLERLRLTPSCKGGDGLAIYGMEHCDECATLIYAAIAAAVEEQTIERCAAAFIRNGDVLADDFEVVSWAERTVRSLPRQWGSTPEEAR